MSARAVHICDARAPQPDEEDPEPDVNVLTRALGTSGPEHKGQEAAEEGLSRLPSRGAWNSNVEQIWPKNN